MTLDITHLTGTPLIRDLRALQRKYGRPSRLSDPCHDNTPASLRALLRTPDSKLRWSDYKALLGPHLPAGTYREVAYFLPLAFDFIRTDTSAALDLCSTLVGFCSIHAEELRTDEVLDTARQQLLALLREWTSRFELIHYDRWMCVQQGWLKRQYFDYVKSSEAVCQTLCDLVEFSTHADLAERSVQELISFGADPIKAAWLLELLRAREDVYPPPPLEPLELASADHALLSVAYGLAQANPEIHDRSPTYWRDVLKQLGMD